MKPFFFLVTLFAVVCFKSNGQEVVITCQRFNLLNTAIRDGKIQKEEAQQQFKTLISKIDNLYAPEATSSESFFPLEGCYGIASIGGKNGNGYKANGYSYFDGNKHKGHPAHDIFIVDKNQDCTDDKTNKSVAVMSIQEGIVVAIESNWVEGSLLRGGKYLWIYNPKTKSLFYYAHNQTILVKVGEYVVAGQRLAYVGRTGLNASQKRSPTHLHCMQLVLDNNMFPTPVNCYNLLCKSRLPKCN